MPTFLGARSATGIADPANPFGAGFWTCTLTPQILGWQVACEIYHTAIQGPTGSAFKVYDGIDFYDYVARGDINSWDPAQPMGYIPGNSIFFYWNTNAAPAPRVTVYGRIP